jgi:hypothetical protein
LATALLFTEYLAMTQSAQGWYPVSAVPTETVGEAR